MRSTDLGPAIAHRLRRPSTWGAALLFGGAWLGVRALLGQPMERLAVGEVLVPLVLLAGVLVLGPIPWQWTGDDRPMAPFARGLLQALAGNALWLWLGLLGLGQVLHPLEPRRTNLMTQPPRRPPPGRQGPPPNLEARPEEVPHPLAVTLMNLPLAMLLGWFLADRERAESAARRLQHLADAARASALQAQLNPHVLFNALSGLSELVHEDPDAAEEALIELSALMRRLLQHQGRQLAPLREERELARSYLTLQKIRLGALLAVEWDWTEGTDALAAPPLLLLPLVENALKHGIAPHPSGGRLRISSRREGDLLRLRVANTGAAQSTAGGHGLGHGNLRERLALLDPRAAFRFGREGEWTVAEVILPVGGPTS